MTNPLHAEHRTPAPIASEVLDRPEARASLRVLRGEAPDTTRFVLKVPRIKVVFQYDGVATRVEWRCAASAGSDCCTPGEEWTRGDNTISLIVQQPDSIMTGVELAGLVMIDGASAEARYLEPYRITDVLNLGQELATTATSALTSRVYDEHGEPSGTSTTKVAATFAPDTSLHLFFRHADADGNPGRIAVFADA